MQIVSACLARDLPVYQVTAESLLRHVPGAEIHVVTRREDFSKFRDACGSDLHLWDESEFVPEMTLAELRKLPFPWFPTGAGWYFQQFLKYAFEGVSNDDEHFLIWDADTVLLRPLEFFDAEGRPIYTQADEYHRPYFETFEALFGEQANREFSFISQHQVIHKKTLRSMLKEIEERNGNGKAWPWAIMDRLRGDGSNLFSEFETYGHYLKCRYPGEFSVRSLRWTRHGGGPFRIPPIPWRLKSLAKQYDFAAFEAKDTWLRYLVGVAKSKLRK